MKNKGIFLNFIKQLQPFFIAALQNGLKTKRLSLKKSIFSIFFIKKYLHNEMCAPLTLCMPLLNIDE